MQIDLVMTKRTEALQLNGILRYSLQRISDLLYGIVMYNFQYLMQRSDTCTSEGFSLLDPCLFWLLGRNNFTENELLDHEINQ